MRLKISGIVEDSIVDGPGMRLAVFAQGCPLRCPGCQNPQTHDMEGGEWMDTNEVLTLLKENPLERGITLSGGEPFAQIEPMEALARGTREMGKHVMAYTGYLFEDLLERPEAAELLKHIDVLVDGPFMLEQRSLGLRFRGSKNQRVLDVPKSLEAKTAIWVDWAEH